MSPFLDSDSDSAFNAKVEARVRDLLRDRAMREEVPARSIPVNKLDPGKTVGSIPVVDGSGGKNTAIWLPPGAAGSVLTRDDTQPGLVAWSFPASGTVFDVDVGTEGISSTTFVTATAPTQVVVPAAGTYLVSWGCAIGYVGTNTVGLMSLSGAGQTPADTVACRAGGSGIDTSVSTARLITLTAGTLTAQFRSSAGFSVTFSQRWLSIIRVS